MRDGDLAIRGRIIRHGSPRERGSGFNVRMRDALLNETPERGPRHRRGIGGGSQHRVTVIIAQQRADLNRPVASTALLRDNDRRSIVALDE